MHTRSLPALAQTKAPAPSDHLDVVVVTRGKNDINTVSFLTQTAHFVSQAINVYLHLLFIKSNSLFIKSV